MTRPVTPKINKVSQSEQSGPPSGTAALDPDETAVLDVVMEVLDGREPVPFDQLVAELLEGGHLEALGIDDQAGALEKVHEILSRHEAATGGDPSEIPLTFGEHQRQLVQAQRRSRFGFDDCCDERYQLVEEAWHRVAHAPGDINDALETEDLPAIAEALAHSTVALALADHAIKRHPQSHERLEAFASRLTQLDGAPAASGRVLQASIAENGGRILDAERLLEQAVRDDPSLGVAKFELARYTAEHGDVTRTLALLTESGQGSRLYLDFLESLTSPVSGVGRNEPCPCGSGRKYKQCCLREPKVSVHNRAMWLKRRLVQFLVSARRDHELHAVAAAAAGPEAGEGTERLASLSGDPFLIALAVHQTDLQDRYLAAKGPLLDDLDLGLLAGWSRSRYQIHEVAATDPGVNLVLREPGTYELVTVTDAFTSSEAQPGDHLLAVVGPVGELDELLAVPLKLADADLEVLEPLSGPSGPDAAGIAAWYGAKLQAPDGES